MKKLIAIIIAFFALRLILQAQQKQEQQNQEAQKQAEENAQKQAEEQVKKQADTLTQINVNNIVSNWYQNYNGKLPVHYEDWVGFTQISKNDWHFVKEAMTSLGCNYKDAYNKIMGKSKAFWKSGFYKKEFDNIRDLLAQRANW